MKRAILAGAVLTLSAGACQLLFPFSLDNTTETRVRALCHLAYGCCTPIERALFVNVAFKDEGSCVAELLEDRGSGAIFQIDQVANDAVARGTGTFDAETAERCMRAHLDANNQCDAAAYFGRDGALDFNRAVLLVDDGDAECFALAQRGFVRGNVDADDECQTDVDCADFGVCDRTPDEGDENIISVKGKCVALHAEGDNCDDGVACQPGLACQFDANNNESTCVTPELLGKGEPCFFDDECETEFCETTIVDGTCAFGGEPCAADADCAQQDDFCIGNNQSECAEPPDVTIEVCDGL